MPSLVTGVAPVFGVKARRRGLGLLAHGGDERADEADAVERTEDEESGFHATRTQSGVLCWPHR